MRRLNVEHPEQAHSLPRLTPASLTKHVVVVGAGSAGMEATGGGGLTERGYRVAIVDKANRLGGSMWFSMMATADNERLVHWFKFEIKRLNIAIELNTRPPWTPTARWTRDHVIVATGAVRSGGALPNVQTGDTLLAMMLGAATAASGAV